MDIIYYQYPEIEGDLWGSTYKVMRSVQMRHRTVVAILLLLAVSALSQSGCGSGGGGNNGGAQTSVPIAAGEFFSLAVGSDGTIWAWGSNYSGQLADSTPSVRHLPVHIPGPGGVGFLDKVVKVAAGIGHSLALKSDGTVWAWGWNGNGQLGDNTTDWRGAPVQVVGPSGVGFLDNIVSIAAGGHSLALRRDGTVWAWGNNYNGQLGDNTTIARHCPVQVVGFGGAGVLSDIISIGACYNNSVSVKSDGTLLTWGRNIYGQLGDNTTIDRYAPVQVRGPGGVGTLTDVSAAAVGEGHYIALGSDGTVWAWGKNYSGQLGDGTTNYRSTPVQVSGPGGSGNLTGVIAVVAGYSHSLAIRSDGTVWAWGSNISGQLGDSTASDRRIPVQVVGSTGDGFFLGVALAAGNYHTLAVGRDGTVWGWGNNYNWQLADTTTINNKYIPFLLPIDL